MFVLPSKTINVPLLTLYKPHLFAAEKNSKSGGAVYTRYKKKKKKKIRAKKRGAVNTRGQFIHR